MRPKNSLIVLEQVGTKLWRPYRIGHPRIMQTGDVVLRLRLLAFSRDPQALLVQLEKMVQMVRLDPSDPLDLAVALERLGHP